MFDNLNHNMNKLYATNTFSIHVRLLIMQLACFLESDDILISEHIKYRTKNAISLCSVDLQLLNLMQSCSRLHSDLVFVFVLEKINLSWKNGKPCRT